MGMARTRAHAAQESGVNGPDAALARRAAAGDREAFEELYTRHAPAARQVALSVTGDPHDAADAVSEAFAKLLQAIADHRLPADASFRPYLLATTRNAAIDGLRRSGRQQPADMIDLERPGLVAGPSEQLIDTADYAFVARAFRSLPERWRSVLWLTEVEKIPARDVAGLLGMSANGVAQLAVRARTGLRQRYLQAHLGNEGVTEACRGTVERLGAYVAGSLSPRDIALVDQHLAGCVSCQTSEEELRDLGTTLRHALLPVPVAGLVALRAAVVRLAQAAAVRLAQAWASAARVAGDVGPGRLAVPVGAASAGLLVASVTGAGIVAQPVSPSRAATPATARPGTRNHARVDGRHHVLGDPARAGSGHEVGSAGAAGGATSGPAGDAATAATAGWPPGPSAASGHAAGASQSSSSTGSSSTTSSSSTSGSSSTSPSSSSTSSSSTGSSSTSSSSTSSSTTTTTAPAGNDGATPPSDKTSPPAHSPPGSDADPASDQGDAAGPPVSAPPVSVPGTTPPVTVPATPGTCGAAPPVAVPPVPTPPPVPAPPTTIPAAPAQRPATAISGPGVSVALRILQLLGIEIFAGPTSKDAAGGGQPAEQVAGRPPVPAGCPAVDVAEPPSSLDRPPSTLAATPF